MSAAAKILIGALAVIAIGWLTHGPFGAGDSVVGGLESRARSTVAATEVPGIEVGMTRAPLTRTATLSGNADRFQRDGQGEFKGLTARVDDIPGINGVGWSDEGGPPARLPLLAEALLMATAAYLAGLGIGKALFGRRRKTSYLD